MALAERIDVGIVIERRRLANPWQAERWKLVDVLPGRPAAPPWTVLGEGDDWRRYYAGAVALELHRTETASYLDNLGSSRPAIYVMLRRTKAEPGLAVHAATVDPGEVDAHAEAGDDLIEALPLPPAIAAWMREFIARHHQERPFYKRQRQPTDPEALARRQRPQERADG